MQHTASFSDRENHLSTSNQISNQIMRETNKRKGLFLSTGLIAVIILAKYFVDNTDVVEWNPFKHGHSFAANVPLHTSTRDFPLHINKYRTCSKGKGISKDWLRREFAHFIKVYDQRPKIISKAGTKMMHQFALWATIRYVISKGKSMLSYQRN